MQDKVATFSRSDIGTVRVLVADDQLLIRMGIRALLSRLPNHVVVGEAEDGRQLVDMIRDLQPDVAIVDIAMPRLSGIEAVLQARRFDTHFRTLYLSALDTPEAVSTAMRTEACGYLLKDFLFEELEEALRSLQMGRFYLCGKLRSLSVNSRSTGSSDAMALTLRQTEVLKRIAAGLSTKQIARELNISPKTVEFHRGQLIERLGLRDVASLTLYASRAGLL